MKLNMTSCVSIPLPLDECIRRLEESVDDKSNPFFRFPLVGKYRVRKINQTRFNIEPRYRGMVIEGFTEQTSSKTCKIFIRLMPPLWFLILFGSIPLLLILLASSSSVSGNDRAGFTFFGFIIWFVIVCIIAAHYVCSLRLFEGCDGLFKSLNAEPIAPEPVTSRKFLRKLGLYLFIAVLYIAVLAIVGFLFSGFD